jgi:hypothetical protein
MTYAVPAVSKLDMFASLPVASKIGLELLDKSSGSPAGNMNTRGRMTAWVAAWTKLVVLSERDEAEITFRTMVLACTDTHGGEKVRLVVDNFFDEN